MFDRLLESGQFRKKVSHDDFVDMAHLRECFSTSDNIFFAIPIVCSLYRASMETISRITFSLVGSCSYWYDYYLYRKAYFDSLNVILRNNKRPYTQNEV